jgi:hypothetical protein
MVKAGSEQNTRSSPNLFTIHALMQGMLLHPPTITTPLIADSS